jgi:hypothetical protein
VGPRDEGLAIHAPDDYDYDDDDDNNNNNNKLGKYCNYI